MICKIKIELDRSSKATEGSLMKHKNIGGYHLYAYNDGEFKESEWFCVIMQIYDQEGRLIGIYSSGKGSVIPRRFVSAWCKNPQNMVEVKCMSLSTADGLKEFTELDSNNQLKINFVPAKPKLPITKTGDFVITGFQMNDKIDDGDYCAVEKDQLQVAQDFINAYQDAFREWVSAPARVSEQIIDTMESNIFRSEELIETTFRGFEAITVCEPINTRLSIDPNSSLYKFLEGERCLSEFREASSKELSFYECVNFKEKAISKSIPKWKDTPQGYFFWQHMDAKFKYYYLQNNE